MARPPKRRLLLAFCAAVCAACNGSAETSTSADEKVVTDQPVPSLTHPVTVSGISSGAYMAVQTHVALSDRVGGAAAIAGGPYHCARESITNALGSCISGEGIDIASLLSFTRNAATEGRIAGTDNLRDAKVWLFHGTEDSVVGAGASAASADFYRQFVVPGNVSFVQDIPAAHGWPTLNTGVACAEMGGDFINACNFDAAGSLLNHLYGELSPRLTSVTAEDLTTVDISAYVSDGSEIANSALVFVPQGCRESADDCRLHFAFHGCRQSAQFLGDRFAANAGINEWAAANRIVVLYPQIEKSLMNPQGCWDWWGYTGSDYDLARGKQIGTIGKLINAWAADDLL